MGGRAGAPICLGRVFFIELFVCFCARQVPLFLCYSLCCARLLLFMSWLVAIFLSLFSLVLRRCGLLLPCCVACSRPPHHRSLCAGRAARPCRRLDGRGEAAAPSIATGGRPVAAPRGWWAVDVAAPAPATAPLPSPPVRWWAAAARGPPTGSLPMVSPPPTTWGRAPPRGAPSPRPGESVTTPASHAPPPPSPPFPLLFRRGRGAPAPPPVPSLRAADPGHTRG